MNVNYDIIQFDGNGTDDECLQVVNCSNDDINLTADAKVDYVVRSGSND